VPTLAVPVPVRAAFSPADLRPALGPPFQCRRCQPPGAKKWSRELVRALPLLAQVSLIGLLVPVVFRLASLVARAGYLC